MMAVEIFNSDGVHTLRSHLSEQITLANRHVFFFSQTVKVLLSGIGLVSTRPL